MYENQKYCFITLALVTLVPVSRCNLAFVTGSLLTGVGGGFIFNYANKQETKSEVKFYPH